MLHNINTIQNLTDITYNTSYTDEYLINALANAGQRLGIKGDSISIGSFTFKDLIKESQNIQSIDPTDYKNYNGFIFYDISNEKKIGRIGLIKGGEIYNNSINKSRNDICKYDDYENIFNKLILNNEFGFDNIINNIEYYTDNNIIEYDENYLYTLLYGKVIGTDESDNNNIEIIYNKYNDSTNRIELSIRVFHLYNNGISNVYCMLVLKQIDLSNYKLEVYQFDTSLLVDNEDMVVKNKFESLFNYSTKDKSILFGKSDINYKDETGLFEYENVTDCTLFGLIKNYELNNMINHTVSINIKYNTDDNQLFSINEDDENKLENINNILSKKNEDINSRLYYFNNDIIYNLPNYIKIYSEKNFVVNIKTLYIRIMFEVYEYLYEKYKTNGVLYIPLDYKFNYIYNQNNELQIFHSEDILLSVINVEDTKDINNEYHLLKGLNKIIFDNRNISNEIFENIKFNINYNNINDKYPSSVNIHHIYTLPYINENNLWVLNDVETDIKAIGKNAGNPNIIILNNRKIGENYITEMSAANINILKSFDHININGYEPIEFILNPNLFIDDITSSSNDFIATGYLPKINESNISLFENCLIFLISSNDLIKQFGSKTDNEEDLTIPEFFSSIWYVDNEKKRFNYVKESGKKYALDLSQILNTHYIIKKYSEIYSHNAKQSVDELKLSVPKNKLQNTINSMSYAILSVEDTSNYDEYYKYFNNDNIDKYQNRLNLSIKFNKQNNDKYLDNITGDGVSNLPYIKLGNTNSGSESNNETVIYKYEIRQVENNISYISAVIDAEKSNILECNYIDNVCYIIVNKDIDKTIESKKISDGDFYKSPIEFQGFYNEYVFNSDVPSLDLKEILMVNSNSLNRLNVISVDKNGTLYNSYIGSSHDDDDKSSLIIGTSTYNINIGNSTLVDINQAFKPQDSIKVNFNNVHLNGITYLNSNTYLNNNFYGNGHVIETQKLLEDLNIKKYTSHELNVYEFKYDKYSYLGLLNNINYGNPNSSSVADLIKNIHISHNTLLTYNDTFGIYKMCTDIINNEETTYYNMKGNFLGIYTRNGNIYNNKLVKADGKPIDNLYLYKCNIIDAVRDDNGNLVDANNNDSITGNILNNVYIDENKFTVLLYLNNIIDEYFNIIYGETLSNIKPENIKIKYYISSKNYEDIVNDTLKKVTNREDNNNTYNINFDKSGLYGGNYNDNSKPIIDDLSYTINFKVNNRIDYFIELPYSDTMFENYKINTKKTIYDNNTANIDIINYHNQYVKLSNDIKFLTYKENDKYVLEIYYKSEVDNLILNLGSKTFKSQDVNRINVQWIFNNKENLI